MIVFQKLWKIFFISSKNLFSFSRYSNFCIFAFPYFSPCQSLLESLIQYKDSDFVNCLNKNLIIHFVWYLEKEKRYDTEPLATVLNNTVLNKKHFYGKIMEKMYTKSSRWPLFYFGKLPKTATACKKFFWKQDILKKDYQKPLKKQTLLFLSNPVLFNGQSYQKQKEPGTSLSSGYKTSSQNCFY